MTRTVPLICLTMLTLGAAALAAGEPSLPANIGAAVADKARPEADTQRDADRKPGESLAFAGVRAGQKVADVIPGGGYFTRLFSAAVGPKGKVYAVAPPKRPDAPASTPEPAARLQPIVEDKAHYGNVSVLTVNMREFKLPEPVDLVWTSQNYHDLHNIQGLDVAAFDKAVFEALKPGGTYVVLDHAAAPGSGFSTTSTLHRIDKDAVRQEVESAGFKFEGESQALHNPDDPHTDKVFEGPLRGKTDQFILKFRKPRS
ncbi:MAG: class I SAM-dependent methyltransferase [Gammaproteobacteria bacterium]|nr:class I SAM-dependent methyltransferase [Gammaproteobacteria bacterium]MBV9695472.1 class I SAM-dependent methyltransferase [Gammaproteobacteria bacterium]